MWLSITKKIKNSEKKITITYNRKIMLALNIILVVLAMLMFLYAAELSFDPKETLKGAFPENDLSGVFGERRSPDYFSGGLIVIFCFAVFNAIVFLARVVIVKDLTDGSIAIQKRALKAGGYTVYKISENPVLKFIKYSMLGDLVLAIVSGEKRTLIFPTSFIDPDVVAHRGNRFKFSKEEAENLAASLGITLSKEIGEYSEDFDEIKKN